MAGNTGLAQVMAMILARFPPLKIALVRARILVSTTNTAQSLGTMVKFAKQAGYGQAQAQINAFGVTGLAQAQAKINAFGVTGLAQARAKTV